jgi:hypothetical protein
MSAPYPLHPPDVQITRTGLLAAATPSQHGDMERRR